jgi:hypothetical protein
MLGRATKLGSGLIGDAPIGVELVGEACVCDQTIVRGRALGHRSTRMQQDRHSIVPRNVLHWAR